MLLEVMVVFVVYVIMCLFLKRFLVVEMKRLNYMCVYVFVEIIEKFEVYSILNGYD